MAVPPRLGAPRPEFLPLSSPQRRLWFVDRLQGTSVEYNITVAWRLRGNTVERLSWSGVDASPREEPVAIPVLANVSALAFRFLDPRSLEWRPAWALPGSPDETLPAAVEATFTLASGEKVVRMVDLPRAP